jgi:L-ascorbate metabolism protein UlaG (beta-lactamase superfamily)
VRELRISWCGQSYFIIRSGDARLAIDPHDGDSLGLPRCEANADYILVTHDHYDHNSVETARGPKTKAVALSREGSFTMGPFSVTGFRLPHDPEGGSRYGWTTAYLVEAEGLRVMHMGDVGVGPVDYIIRPVGKVDVIMVPAGNVTTVRQAEALEWAARLGARLVLPMHYWVVGSNVPLDPIDVILSLWRGPVTKLGEPLDVEPGRLNGPALVILPLESEPI